MPHRFRISALVFAVTASLVAGDARGDELRFTIREPYGVLRHGYPQSVPFTLPQAVAADTPFRLLRDGRPVRAQFRPHATDGKSNRWWVDFPAVLAPHETAEFVIEYGTGIEPGPTRDKGHVLSQTDDAYVIANAPYISWTIPRDLSGLVKSVQYPPTEHLRDGASGLMLRDIDGKTHMLGGAGTTSRVIRQGPMAVALQFEKRETDPALAGVSWTVDLVFPARVSWIDVSLKLDDPQQRVAAAGWELRLNLDPPTGKTPTLVEFGASRTVYGALVNGRQMELIAAPKQPWRVLRGAAGDLQPMVTAPAGSTAAVEGWAHVMDRRRCLALAIDGFSKAGEDRLNVAADGTMVFWRTFGHEVPDKSLRSWFHFVHFPHQAGAATSPQSMQNPPVVTFDQQ